MRPSNPRIVEDGRPTIPLQASSGSRSVPLGSGSGINESLLATIRQIHSTDPLFAPHADVAFERLDELGRGGMGVVFRVRDRRLGREAALKLLLNKADEGSLRRFLREARLTARLDHPGVPPVYEAGRTSQGAHFILMKIIAGETLAARLATLEVGDEEQERRLLVALLRVSETIAYAHSNEIAHRDLKPLNIMLGDFGEVSVLDWGIAKDLSLMESEAIPDAAALELSQEALNAGLTVAGTMLGTPGYMAPEQLDGEGGKPADVFGLGCILVEILCGERAISGADTMGCLLQTARGEVKLPRDLRPDAPRELNALAAAALSLDPRARPSIDEFSLNLRSYLSGEPLPLCQYGVGERLLRWSKKRTGSLLATTTLALLLGVSSVAALSVEGARRRALVARTDARRAMSEAGLADRQRADAEDATRLAKVRANQAEQKRLAAEVKASSLKRVDELLESAASLARKQSSLTELRQLVSRAVAESGQKLATMLRAAQIYRNAQLLDECRSLLEAAVRIHPPGYEALIFLHRLELSENPGRKRWMTPALKRLVKIARRRGEENVFTLASQATEAIDEGRFREGLSILNRAIESEAQPPPLVFLLRCVTFTKLGKVNQATADIERVLSYDPTDPRALNSRGVLRLDDNRLDLALADFDGALENSKNFVTALNNRGLVLLRMGRRVEASQTFIAALKIDPGYLTARANLGVCFLAERDFPAAERCAMAVLAKDPNSFTAILGLVRVRLAQGRLKEAQKLALKGREAHPKKLIFSILHCTAIVAMGQLAEGERLIAKGLVGQTLRSEWLQVRARLRQRQGRLQEALADFTSYIDGHPRQVGVLFDRGRVRATLKNFVGAERDFAAAVRLDPRLKRAHFFRGMCLSELGRFEASEKSYSAAIRCDRKFISAYLKRAGLAIHRKHPAEALADLNVAIRLDPTKASYYINRGAAYSQLGDDKHAAEDYAKAIALDAKAVMAYNNRACLFLKTNDLAAALADIRMAARLEPRNTIVQGTLGEVLYAKKDLSGARAAWDRALEIDPKNLSVLVSRGELFIKQGLKAEALRDLRRFLKLQRESPKAARIRKLVAALEDR